jgi:hypothetical protein
VTTTYEGLLDAIQGFDTTSFPPCEILLPLKDGRTCGKPSCKRIHCRCRCGKAAYLFMCRTCDEKIATFGGTCNYCGSSEFTLTPA